MPLLSLREAAEESGKSHTTISRAIKSGKLSASKNEDGAYEIDTSELNRVYPLKTKQAPSSATSNAKQELLHKLEMLQAAMTHKDEMIERERTALRRQRDQYEDQISDLRNTVETLEKQNGATLQLIATEVQKPQEATVFFKGWFKKTS